MGSKQVTIQPPTVIRSPFRFVGSKHQAVKFIKPLWESVPHDEYREPLVGGGSVFFAKPKAKINWLNDLDKELMTTYSVMQSKTIRGELIKSVTKEKPTKDRHQQVKNSDYAKNNDLAVAHRYYYLNRTSYSGIMRLPPYGYSDTKSVPPERWGDRIEQAGKKLQDVKLTNHDFSKIIKTSAKGKIGVFMFIDPPYFLADQKRAYIHPFEIDDHYRLSKILKKTRHKFCLTYDDCNEIREMYDWAFVKHVSWRYHIANSNVTSRKMGNELLITNFEQSTSE